MTARFREVESLRACVGPRLNGVRCGGLAYFILDLVEDLDLREIERVLQAKDPRGERPYSPRMMTTLWLYGYAVGVTSSRKLEKATYQDVAFRVLVAGEQLWRALRGSSKSALAEAAAH